MFKEMREKDVIHFDLECCLSDQAITELHPPRKDERVTEGYRLNYDFVMQGTFKVAGASAMQKTGIITCLLVVGSHQLPMPTNTLNPVLYCTMQYLATMFHIHYNIRYALELNHGYLIKKSIIYSTLP